MLTSTNSAVGNNLVSLWPSGVHPPPASRMGLQWVISARWCWYWLWPWACHYTLSRPAVSSSLNGRDLDKIILRASSRLAKKNNSGNQWQSQDIFCCNWGDQAFLLSGYAQSGSQAILLSFIVFFPNVLHFHQSSARQIVGQPKRLLFGEITCLTEVRKWL